MKTPKIADGSDFDFSKTYVFTDGYDDFWFSPPYMIGVDEEGDWWVEQGISGVKANLLWVSGTEPWRSNE